METAPDLWVRVSHSAKREVQPARLFVEKPRLTCGSGGGRRFAAGDADHAEDGKFTKCGPGYEDAVGGGIEVGRSDLDAVIEHREQVVGDHAFDGLAIAVAEANPESIQLGTAEEDLALGLEVVGKLANKIDGAHSGERDFLMLAVRGEKVDGVSLAETARVQIAAKGLFVGKKNDDFLVSRGWGAVFQRNQSVKVGNGRNLRIIKMYVMLSALFLSTYCFH